MSLRAGFAERDITPPLGTHKIGWLNDIVPDTIADPLYTRAAVIEGDGGRVGFLALDTLSIRWTTTEQIRAAVAANGDLSAERLMVAATHNHGGPAVAGAGEVRRDDAYVATLIDACVAAVAEAAANLVPAEVGVGSVYEFEAAHNRRVVQRDGTVKTHVRFRHPECLALEGPIDPEVAVLAARDLDGKWLGALVNFTCHPTHHGGDAVFSAGYPGVLVDELKQAGLPTALFLQGAAGNIHYAIPEKGHSDDPTMEQLGRMVAAAAQRALGELTWHSTLTVDAVRGRVDLPHREPTEAEVTGQAFGAQQFRPPVYEAGMPALVERIQRQPLQPAEVQVLALGEHRYVSLPCEPFVELGLEIKQLAWPRVAKVVGYANGMVGYVPHRAAFAGGGYETTFISSSRLAPEAGELLVAKAAELLDELSP